MNPEESFSFEFPKSPRKFPFMVTDSTNMIAVYTVLCILRNMKEQICLEAMLEYMEKYLMAVERHNPRLRNAVLKVISTIDIEKIYKDAML
jgi:hypothetical protein